MLLPLLLACTPTVQGPDAATLLAALGECEPLPGTQPFATDVSEAGRPTGQSVDICGMEGANSAEFDPETPYPVVDLLPEQKEVTDLGGTMRLGADPVKLHEGTRAREIFGGEGVIYKRHRHRFEVNNMLRRRLEDEGLVMSGTSPDERLVEIVELPDHPFFVASQFHPEFNSRPTRPEPLFRDFVGAAKAQAGSVADEPGSSDDEITIRNTA